MNIDYNRVLENFTQFNNFKTPYIVDISSRSQNVNVLRDINNLGFQIEYLERQKEIYISRMVNLNKCSNIDFVLKLSVLIVVLNIIIPFLVVLLGIYYKVVLLENFSKYINCLKNLFFWYLLFTFILSMILMIVYLFNFANEKKL